MTGAAEFTAAAQAVLARSCTTQVVVIAAQFRILMKQKGMPDDVIEESLESASIDDKSYLTDWPRT